MSPRSTIWVVRNNWGIDLEKRGDVDGAIALYEANVAEGFEGSHPYNRLVVIYRKRKDDGNEVRVLRTAVSRYEGYAANTGGGDASPKLAKFRDHLEKAEVFMAKANQSVASVPDVTPPKVTQDRVDAWQAWLREGGRRDLPIWPDDGGHQATETEKARVQPAVAGPVHTKPVEIGRTNYGFLPACSATEANGAD